MGWGWIINLGVGRELGDGTGMAGMEVEAAAGEVLWEGTVVPDKDWRGNTVSGRPRFCLRAAEMAASSSHWCKWMNVAISGSTMLELKTSIRACGTREMLSKRLQMRRGAPLRSHS